MKKSIKLLSLMLVLCMILASFTACNGKQTAADLEGYGAWKGEQVFEIDEKVLEGYTFRLSAYRDFSSDPQNCEYADGGEDFLAKYPAAAGIEYLTVGDHTPDAIAAAVAAGELGICMAASRDISMDKYYKENMLPEDYEIVTESYKNIKPLEPSGITHLIFTIR